MTKPMGNYTFILIEEIEFGSLILKGVYNDLDSAVGDAMTLIWKSADEMKAAIDSADFKFVKMEEIKSASDNKISSIKLCFEYDEYGDGEYKKEYYHILFIKEKPNVHDSLAELSTIINNNISPKKLDE